MIIHGFFLNVDFSMTTRCVLHVLNARHKLLAASNNLFHEKHVAHWNSGLI